MGLLAIWSARGWRYVVAAIWEQFNIRNFTKESAQKCMGTLTGVGLTTKKSNIFFSFWYYWCKSKTNKMETKLSPQSLNISYFECSAYFFNTAHLVHVYYRIKLAFQTLKSSVQIHRHQMKKKFPEVRLAQHESLLRNTPTPKHTDSLLVLPFRSIILIDHCVVAYYWV